MTDDLRDVKLNTELCEAAEKKYGVRFGGLDAFLNFLLQQLLREDAAEMDQNERRVIEQRLKDLGYL